MGHWPQTLVSRRLTIPVKATKPDHWMGVSRTHGHGDVRIRGGGYSDAPDEPKTVVLVAYVRGIPMRWGCHAHGT